MPEQNNAAPAVIMISGLLFGALLALNSLRSEHAAPTGAQEASPQAVSSSQVAMPDGPAEAEVPTRHGI